MRTKGWPPTLLPGRFGTGGVLVNVGEMHTYGVNQLFIWGDSRAPGCLQRYLISAALGRGCLAEATQGLH